MSERERGVQCDTSFNELSPRPWVPGEERAHCKADNASWTSKSLGPPPQPRRSSNYLYNDGCVAPLGYEPEGAVRILQPRDSPPTADATTSGTIVPSCLRWARTLHHLLEDSDGVDLFRRYLQAENRPHADALDFWFACEGLRKQTEPEKIHQLVKAIYRRFFIKSALPLSDELRREVGRQVKETKASGERQETLFDMAQIEVEKLINNSTYANFLKSDMYLQYVQAMQNPGSSELSSGSGSSSSSSSISAREMALLTQGSGLLPTLHEDSELITNCSVALPHSSSTGSVSAGYHTPVEPMRLTKDMLLATQKRRLDVRPKPEAYAGMFGMGMAGYRINGPYHHPHASYSSYNPVSRQDSELQSLSSHSDARTESDNISLTDSSVDGMSVFRSSRKQNRQACRQARELAALNRDPYMHQTMIPRTQRIDNKQCQPLNPEDFASILIEKLENLKRKQDAEDKLDRKLLEGECSGGPEPGPGVQFNEDQAKAFADAIRSKLHIVDDSDQDILDQHVSRVWSDTPSRSPGLVSPRTHSPARRCNINATGYFSRSRRKEKDVFSTFSADSGNVYDFPDTSSLGHGHSHTAMVKSKSMPEDNYLQDRFVRQSASRRSSSKKTLTDLTDSGVSVVSDTPPVPPLAVQITGKETRVVTWLMESDRPTRSHTHSELSGGGGSKHSRHRKGYVHSHSRSSSLERCSAASSGGDKPSQSYVADVTASQLEEARRRLIIEDELRARQARQRGKSSHIHDSLSNQSTLKKSGNRGPRPSTQANFMVASSSEQAEFTTVVFSFCEEQFPYRTKIPGTKITLRQFKEYLPKKGNYRYFFKTECEELNNQVIQEEISCDSDLLPLFEGKVMAQVKPTD